MRKEENNIIKSTSSCNPKDSYPIWLVQVRSGRYLEPVTLFDNININGDSIDSVFIGPVSCDSVTVQYSGPIVSNLTIETRNQAPVVINCPTSVTFKNVYIHVEYDNMMRPSNIVNALCAVYVSAGTLFLQNSRIIMTVARAEDKTYEYYHPQHNVAALYTIVYANANQLQSSASTDASSSPPQIVITDTQCF